MMTPCDITFIILATWVDFLRIRINPIDSQNIPMFQFVVTQAKPVDVIWPLKFDTAEKVLCHGVRS